MLWERDESGQIARRENGCNKELMKHRMFKSNGFLLGMERKN